MADYKLMPVEPTPEMLEAGEYAQYTGCYVSGIYADMLAEAPTISIVATKNEQGQIVSVTLQGEDHRILEVIAEADEQQPAPDVPGLTEALRQYQHNDGSGLVFGYDKLLVDQCVAHLVEALEWLRGAINATPENDKNQTGTWISTKHPRIKQIDAILAAHRKQGGDPQHCYVGKV